MSTERERRSRYRKRWKATNGQEARDRQERERTIALRTRLGTCPDCGRRGLGTGCTHPFHAREVERALLGGDI